MTKSDPTQPVSLVFIIIEIMTVQYKYFICDVFTKKRFGGNPLAVLPNAGGLTDKQMQQIAREINLSEKLNHLFSKCIAETKINGNYPH